MTRLKFLLQRVVDSLIVGDDHRVTSHRAVILNTMLKYPALFVLFSKGKEKKISKGLGIA